MARYCEPIMTGYLHCVLIFMGTYIRVDTSIRYMGFDCYLYYWNTTK